jgi:hypothetical protein
LSISIMMVRTLNGRQRKVAPVRAATAGSRITVR